MFDLSIEEVLLYAWAIFWYYVAFGCIYSKYVTKFVAFISLCIGILYSILFYVNYNGTIENFVASIILFQIVCLIANSRIFSFYSIVRSICGSIMTNLGAVVVYQTYPPSGFHYVFLVTAVAGISLILNRKGAEDDWF